MRRTATVEEHLAKASLAFTMLKPIFSMQNLLNQAAAIKGAGAFYSNYRQGAIAMVDARDVAAGAAGCLTEDGHQGKTYMITGPEAITGQSAADQLGAVRGKRIDYVDIPTQQAVENMIKSGVPGWLASDLALRVRRVRIAAGA
jgi:uncharacterized protein YbjT (DUF2867 family)